MSLPPLPQPFDRVRRRLDPMYTSLYTEAQMLAYGRAVREAALEEAAKVCDATAAKPSSLWEEHGCWSHAAENCAAAIRAIPVED